MFKWSSQGFEVKNTIKFLKSLIEWQDFGILHKIPDIWTAATPVIIHEAALKGSARRRWWGWSGGEGGWLWWWYCWNVYSSSATKFQNISLHLQIVCRENYLGLRNLTKWKMSRTNKTDIRDFDEQTGGNDDTLKMPPIMMVMMMFRTNKYLGKL